MRNLIANAAAALVMAAIPVPAGPAWSATFAAWQVRGVPFGDVLDVRKYPASNSQKQGAHPNGTELSMTGTCTGGVNLLEIGGLPEWKQRQTARFRRCQVWHDPARNGDFVTGWVYGRSISNRIEAGLKPAAGPGAARYSGKGPLLRSRETCLALNSFVFATG